MQPAQKWHGRRSYEDLALLADVQELVHLLGAVEVVAVRDPPADSPKRHVVDDAAVDAGALLLGERLLGRGVADGVGLLEVPDCLRDSGDPRAVLVVAGAVLQVHEVHAVLRAAALRVTQVFAVGGAPDDPG